MITFFRRALKNWRNKFCYGNPPLHFWRDEPVLNASGDPTRIVVTRCTNCGTNYTWWRD